MSVLKSKIQILFYCTLHFSVLSQTFNENYGVFEIGWADIAEDVEYINDSIYIFYTDQNALGGARPCVSNISLVGELNWSKCLDTPGVVRSGGRNFVDFNQNTGEYISALAYQTNIDSLGQELRLAEIIKFNEFLDTVYTNIIGDSVNFYTLRQAKFTPDGGAIAIGWMHYIEPQESPWHLYLVKFDSEGELEWDTIHSSTPGGWNTASWDTGFSVAVTDEGNYIVGSAVSDFWGLPNWPVVSLFDSQGNFIDDRHFGSDLVSEGTANVAKLTDGNFLFCSSKQSDFEEDNYYLVKFDSELSIIWQKEYPFYTNQLAFHQVKENEDGTLYGCGYWRDATTGHDFGSILKFDHEGGLIWHRLYQNSDEGIIQFNWLYDIIAIPNNEGYVACGETYSADTGQDYWVLKVDSMGCLVEGCDTITSITELQELDELEIGLSPNPASDFLNVFIPDLPSSLRGETLSAILRDNQGRTIEELPFSKGNITHILDVSSYERGGYLLSVVYNEKELITQKIVLE